LNPYIESLNLKQEIVLYHDDTTQMTRWKVSAQEVTIS